MSVPGALGRPALRPYEGLYRRLLRRSKIRVRDVEISYEEFLHFTTIFECHYCAGSIDWSKFGAGYKGKSAGYHLDRKDNRVGYTKDNIVVCCNRCNKAKRDLFTYEEWIVMTSALKEHYGTVIRPIDCEESQKRPRV